MFTTNLYRVTNIPTLALHRDTNMTKTPAVLILQNKMPKNNNLMEINGNCG